MTKTSRTFATSQWAAFFGLLIALLSAMAVFAPASRAVAKYKICDSGRETLIPASGDWAGCYVADSKANIEFARKVVDKRFTDKLEPEGDNYGNTPQGKMDCKAFFDRKDRRSGLLHCIRTFAWIHTHDKSAHRGTCQSQVVLTYVMGGTRRKGGKLYLRMVPNAVPNADAWTHDEFRKYYGKAGAPAPEQCRSWAEHELLVPLPDDPLTTEPRTPPTLDPA